MLACASGKGHSNTPLHFPFNIPHHTTTTNDTTGPIPQYNSTTTPHPHNHNHNKNGTTQPILHHTTTTTDETTKLTPHHHDRWHHKNYTTQPISHHKNDTTPQPIPHHITTQPGPMTPHNHITSNYTSHHHTTPPMTPQDDKTNTVVCVKRLKSIPHFPPINGGLEMKLWLRLKDNGF